MRFPKIPDMIGTQITILVGGFCFLIGLSIAGASMSYLYSNEVSRMALFATPAQRAILQDSASAKADPANAEVGTKTTLSAPASTFAKPEATTSTSTLAKVEATTRTTSTSTASTIAKVDATTKTTSSKSPTADSTNTQKPCVGNRTHKIAWGETLSGISVKYFGRKTYVNFLAKENQLADEDVIIAGKSLAIPCVSELPAKKSVPATQTSVTGSDTDKLKSVEEGALKQAISFDFPTRGIATREWHGSFS